MGESERSRAREVTAVRTALELGYRLVDTAEMYGEGGAEQVVGQALGDSIEAGTVSREDVFVVSKVYPHNASRKGVPQACRRSLARLRLERLDLYLLHWRGRVPLRETVEAFEELRAEGLIARWGVSNFDMADMEELWQLPSGPQCALNQVYYSASERGVEFDLLPWQQDRGVPLMAYCPIDQGALAGDPAFARIAARHDATAAQAALAWVLRRQGVIAIPKAQQARHLEENLGACGVRLTDRDLAEVDQSFPPPSRKKPLAMT